jgi:sortase A
VWSVVFESGLTLIVLGVVVLLFAAYQLWGTGVAEARSQHRLARQFSGQLSGQVPTTAPTKATPITTTPTTAIPVTTTAPAVPLPAPGAVIQEGQAVGKIEIPRISVSQYFVQGVGDNDLREGPGHYPGTPYPGEAGNAAIAGHRTTFGAPFYRLNDLSPGDQIITTTRAGRFVYLVDKVLTVRPSQTEILNATPDNRLTLTTCNPRFSAAQRLVVVASLQNPVVAPRAPQVVPAHGSQSSTGEEVTLGSNGTTGAGRPAAVASPALSGSSDAWPPTIAWAAAFVALWVLTRIGFRKWRPRWAFLAAGIPLCLIVLWPLFESVTRILPSNI